MKNKKKYLVTLTISCIIGLTALMAGITFNGVSTTGSIIVTQEAWFTPAWEVTSNAGYGLTAGEKVNRTYVRIIEGQFDTGRVWSALATDDESWNIYSISTSKFNMPFSTMYTYYGWTYFS